MTTTLEHRGPGVWPDMPDAEYFAHPALSHSDCKLLLRSPAKFRYAQDHDTRWHKPEFDFGHVVHELVLGAGAGIDVVDADNWRSKNAQTQRDESRAAGRAPILRADYTAAQECAEAVLLHPLAAKLLTHLDHAEVAVVWDDGDVQRRAKLDGVAGRFAVDLKTADSADTDRFGRIAASYGYHSQDAWYRDAMRACLGVEDPVFLFVVVEKSPPYLVNVIQLDSYDVDLGARHNRRAIDLYRQCRDTNTWPGYGDGINTCTLPRWAEIEEETA